MSILFFFGRNWSLLDFSKIKVIEHFGHFLLETWSKMCRFCIFIPKNCFLLYFGQFSDVDMPSFHQKTQDDSGILKVFLEKMTESTGKRAKISSGSFSRFPGHCSSNIVT